MKATKDALNRFGYNHLSKTLHKEIDQDIKKSGGRIWHTTCPHCGCQTFNGRCPNCGEKSI